MSFELIGMEQFQRALARIGDDKAITRVASNSLRRGARRMASETVKQGRTRGVLRTIYGKKASGLRKLIHAGKVKKVGGTLEIRVSVKGLARIQDMGDRVQRHVIPRAFGRTGSVEHPGMQHKAIPIFTSLVGRWREPAMEDLRRSFTEYFIKAAAGG